MAKHLLFLVHCVAWPKERHGVLSNVLYKRKFLCPFQWHANWLRLLLDCFARATLPESVYRNWPNRICSSCRTMHSHRAHYSRWYRDMVNRALDRRCPHNLEWPASIVEIWNDRLPAMEKSMSPVSGRHGNSRGTKTIMKRTCRQMTSGSFCMISCRIRYLRASHVKASAGQRTKLSLCWPNADFVTQFKFQRWRKNWRHTKNSRGRDHVVWAA